MKLAWLGFALLLVASPLSSQEAAPPAVAVTYTLDATQPKSGVVKVEMLVKNNRDDEVTLGIPVWAPGSYRVVSYYQGVRDLEAEIDGKKVDVTPTDHKSLWKVKTNGSPRFKVRYSLKPGEVPPIRGHLTEEHYDLQGPSAWLYVKDRMNGPHKVRFKLPPEWKVGTGLKKLDSTTYGARDYDTFIDCPIELGKFSLQTFELGGGDYELVLHSTEEFAVSKLIDVCRKIIAEQTRMFGGAPFDRYVFLYHFRQFGGSGLEHLNSTHITYPMSRVKEDPTHVASITSHEFFHLWNVKRIRPKELGPFDYSQPVRSKALWLCEGVTSYYGDLTLVRAGVWTREAYLAHLAEEITFLQGNPARKTQSVEQASWTVWDRPYGARSLTAVDYYNKGELLGWLLDLKIRHATQGLKSFDDVMRLLYRKGVLEPSKAGRGPIGVGFEENGILKAVNVVSGRDFTDFFTRYVSGTEELPYAESIGLFGLSMSRQKSLGLFLRDLRVLIDPPPDSDANKAGVKRNDQIVKVNDTAVGKSEQLSKALDSVNLGEKVTVQIKRQGEKAPIQVELPVVEGSYVLSVLPDPTEAQKALLKGWLAPSK